MAIEYRFLDRGDEALVKTSELPVEGGIAVAVRTTGYELGKDEVIELSVVSLTGEVLFSQRVRPQNAEEAFDEAASGSITPADVEEAPEFYQFEDEVCAVFEGASIVVGQHVDFIHGALESGWVSLPDYEALDLIAEFCASHCAADYPGQPAAVATLQGIADYYGLPCDERDTAAIAQTVAACYLKLREEHASEWAGKSPARRADYERKLEEEARLDERRQEAARVRDMRTYLVNALLWLVGAAIFANLALGMLTSGSDGGVGAIVAIASAFCVVRWAMCLYNMYKIRARKDDVRKG